MSIFKNKLILIACLFFGVFWMVVIFMISKMVLVSNKITDEIKGQVCSMASALTVYDETNERMYSFVKLDAGYPVIKGARGWYYKCNFDGNRIFVTGKNPNTGWRSGPGKWNDSPAWGRMSFRVEGNIVTVTHISSDGSKRTTSSYIAN